MVASLKNTRVATVVPLETLSATVDVCSVVCGDWTRDANGEGYIKRLVKSLGRDPTADLSAAGRQLKERLEAAISAAEGRTPRATGGYVPQALKFGGAVKACPGTAWRIEKTKAISTTRPKPETHL